MGDSECNPPFPSAAERPAAMRTDPTALGEQEIKNQHYCKRNIKGQWEWVTANDRSPVSSAFVELDDKREEKWSDDQRGFGRNPKI